jgi:pyruvate formate lyase activating enzyme
MQGLIFNIRSFSVHDGPGIRQTIFFKGCPLICSWCHNPESRSNETEVWTKSVILEGRRFEHDETIGRWVSIDELMEKILKDVPFFEESEGGITLSGGEPLAQAEFAEELLRICKSYGIHTAVDTCGYAEPEDFERIIPYTNLFLYDLKIADSKKHKEFVGKYNDLILSNLSIISGKGKIIHIRIPLLENITDVPENLESIRSIISQTKGIERIDLLPYHFSAKNKYDRLNKDYNGVSTKSYPKEKALKIKDFFKNAAPVISIGG